MEDASSFFFLFLLFSDGKLGRGEGYLKMEKLVYFSNGETTYPIHVYVRQRKHTLLSVFAIRLDISLLSEFPVGCDR